MSTKERPIIFSTAMVQAILAGRKTQTRRVVDPKKLRLTLLWEHRYHAPTGLVTAGPGVRDAYINKYGTVSAKHGSQTIGLAFGDYEWVCPYGRVGDRLWVRETFFVECYTPVGYAGPVFYRATNSAVCGRIPKWRPAIHMPRALARIELEITGVAVEPLNFISAADAIEEGMIGVDGLWIKKNFPDYWSTWEKWRFDGRDPQKKGPAPLGPGPVERFRKLWGEINGAKPGRAWDDNPLVWVITFKRVGDQ